VVEATDPVTGLEEATSGLVNPVYVVTSLRYPHRDADVPSTTERLVQVGHHPVLVVPAPVEWPER
jgi:hypothetical protein